MFWEKVKNIGVALLKGLLILIIFLAIVAAIVATFAFLAWYDPRLCGTVFCVLAGLAFFLAIIYRSKDVNHGKATPMGWLMAAMFAAAYGLFIPITIYTKAILPLYVSVGLIITAVAIMLTWCIARCVRWKLVH